METKPIIDEVHEWASQQPVVQPLSKEFIGKILEKGNKLILERHLELCYKHITTQEKLLDAMLLLEMQEEQLRNKALSNVH